jgi:hypothetical protein
MRFYGMPSHCLPVILKKNRGDNWVVWGYSGLRHAPSLLRARLPLRWMGPLRLSAVILLAMALPLASGVDDISADVQAALSYSDGQGAVAVVLKVDGAGRVTALAEGEQGGGRASRGWGLHGIASCCACRAC